VTSGGVASWVKSWLPEKIVLIWHENRNYQVELLQKTE